MTVRVEGLDDLIKGLRAGNKDYPKRQAVIHKKVATVVAKEAEGRVRVRTGRLKGSIRPLAGQKYARVRAGRKGLDKRTGYDYAPRHHWSQGTPFLTDALEAKQDEIIDIYVKETDKFLDGIFKTI